MTTGVGCLLNRLLWHAIGNHVAGDFKGRLRPYPQRHVDANRATARLL